MLPSLHNDYLDTHLNLPYSCWFASFHSGNHNSAAVTLFLLFLIFKSIEAAHKILYRIPSGGMISPTNLPVAQNFRGKDCPLTIIRTSGLKISHFFLQAGLHEPKETKPTPMTNSFYFK